MLIYYLMLILGFISGLLLLLKIPRLHKTKSDISEIKVSIVIPARNEQISLPLLLNDLLKQSIKIHEIICVDDNSTDDTFGIIKQFGVNYVKIDNKPNDWNGKTWACQKGAEKSTGDLIIFIDADVRLGEYSIENLLIAHLKYGGVVSVQPYHQLKEFYEQFAFFFNIIGVAGNGVAFPFYEKKAGLFGPIILIKKVDFDKVDGYYNVRKSVIEDVEFASVLSEKNVFYKLFVGDNTISFKMYKNIKELFWGFTKNYASGATKAPFILLFLVFLWVQSMTAFPIIIVSSLMSGNVNELLFGGFMYMLTCLHLIFIGKKIGSFKIIYIILYPLLLIFFHIVFFYSIYAKLFIKKVKWKDRDISL